MKTSPRQSSLRFLHFWLPAVLILLLGLTLRLLGTMQLPLFIDEAQHLYRAHKGMEGQFFFWNLRKWLYPVFLSFFRPGGPEGPWLARSLSALLGVFTIGGCLSLGRMLAKPRVGLVAGLFYAVLPLAVFHERQALADPLLTALVTLSVVLSLRIAHRPTIQHGLALGLCLSAAYLTKISALPFLGLPFWASLLLAPKDRRGRALAVNALALALVAAVVISTYNYVLQHGGVATPAAELAQSRLTELVVGEAGSENTLPLLERLRGGLVLTAGVISSYIGWGMVALVIAAVLWALRGVDRRQASFLFAPAILFTLGPMLANRPLDTSRYFEPNGPTLVTLAALAWESTTFKLDRRWSAVAPWVGTGVVLVVLAQALWFDLTLMIDPARAPLTQIDRSQYFDNSPAGGAYAALSADLVAFWRTGEADHLNVLGAGPINWIRAYLGPRVGNCQELQPGDPAQARALARWLAQGDQVYMVEEVPLSALPEVPHGAHLEFIRSYRDGFRTLRLFRIVAAEGPLAEAIYAARVPHPETLQQDIEALSADTAGLTGPLVVFPASYAEVIGAAIRSDAIGFEVGIWPLTSEAVDQTISRLIPAAGGNQGSAVDVIIVHESSADPPRLIASAFQQRLYRTDEAWYGLLHRMSYVTGPDTPPLSLIGARFEGGIELVEGAILDTAVRPGQAVRVVLVWRAPEAIRDSFKVFAHIVDQEEVLWAQYDSIPGGGLLPMTIWQPGEPITDRFAIWLPGDLPPGSYEIRVGIYHPASALRLPVLSAVDSGPDYVVLGRLVVPGP